MPWLDTGIESGKVVVDLLNTFDIRMPQVVEEGVLNQITLHIERFLEILTGLPQVNWTLAFSDSEDLVYHAEYEGEEDCEVPGELARLLQ